LTIRGLVFGQGVHGRLPDEPIFSDALHALKAAAEEWKIKSGNERAYQFSRGGFERITEKVETTEEVGLKDR
jgi:hypothetical protein